MILCGFFKSQFLILSQSLEDRCTTNCNITLVLLHLPSILYIRATNISFTTFRKKKHQILNYEIQ